MQHPIDPAIDFNSIRDAIESMLVGRDQLVDDRDMQNILIAILEYSRQQRAVCQNPYINNATNTWYVYDSNGNPYDTNVSAEGTIIRQTEAQSIEGDPRVTLTQIDPMKPNEMKMTIYIPKGERGESGSVVTIVDGYWYIDGVNTGVVATGEAPTISEDGYWVVGGEKTEFKAVGTDGRDGVDGQNGADGYSPTATVVKTGNTATIEITDENGTTTATISDGINGTDGQDGEDGFSPEVEVIQGDNSATINITDKTGQHSATISGLDGSYVPLYSTEKDWENRANWGNHYRVLMYGKQGYLECYSTGIVPLYMCPIYQNLKLSTYTGNLNGQCYDTSGTQANITLLCSTYLDNEHSSRIKYINNINKQIDANGYITLSDYIDLYNNYGFTSEIKKIRYLDSLNSNNISNFKVKVADYNTRPKIHDTQIHCNGQLVSTNYNIDQKGNLDNESYGHLFPLRANKTYQIRVYLNKTYEKTYSENNSEIVTGLIQTDKYYTVIGGSGSYITYNELEYNPGDIFKGVQGVTSFTPINGAKVYKVYLNPLTKQPVEITSGDIQKDVYYTVIEERYSYIIYNENECGLNNVFTGVENVTDFTSIGGAKVYAYPLTEPPVEIESGNIEKDANYIVIMGEPYITYNELNYNPGDIFRGIEGVTDFTSSGRSKVYTSVQPNGNASVYTRKPWKQEDMLLMFHTDDKAKISNYCYNFDGDMSKYDENSNDDNNWEYGDFKIFSINGDLFFAVDMRGVDKKNSAHSEDIYGNWESVENEHWGDTTKDIANFTLLLDVVENDLTQVTTNNDLPTIEQS